MSRVKIALKISRDRPRDLGGGFFMSQTPQMRLRPIPNAVASLTSFGQHVGIVRGFLARKLNSPSKLEGVARQRRGSMAPSRVIPLPG